MIELGLTGGGLEIYGAFAGGTMVSLLHDLIQQIKDLDNILADVLAVVVSDVVLLSAICLAMYAMSPVIPSYILTQCVSWDMKGCICHFTKWQIHPFISKPKGMDGTKRSL